MWVCRSDTEQEQCHFQRHSGPLPNATSAGGGRRLGPVVANRSGMMHLFTAVLAFALAFQRPTSAQSTPGASPYNVLSGMLM